MFPGFDMRPTSGTVSKGSLPSKTAIGPDYSARPTVAMLQNPTLRANVPEPMVNSTASAPIFVRPYSQEFQTKFCEGDLLFVKRDDAASKNGHHIVANLPVLNYLLRTEKDKDGRQKYNSVNDVIEGFGADGKGAWRFLGIMRNDMDTDGSKLQRLLNVDMRGRSRVARLWKPSSGHLQRGDTVWIGVHEMTLNTPTAIMNPNSIPEVHRNGVYVQVRAVVPGTGAWDECEICFPVGMVSQATMKIPSDNSINKAHQELNASNALERIEVLMRI